MGIFLGNSFYNCYGSCTGIGTDRQIMPICVLFITYYSILEVWTSYPRRPVQILCRRRHLKQVAQTYGCDWSLNTFHNNVAMQEANVGLH